MFTLSNISIANLLVKEFAALLCIATVIGVSIGVWGGLAILFEFAVQAPWVLGLYFRRWPVRSWCRPRPLSWLRCASPRPWPCAAKASIS